MNVHFSHIRQALHFVWTSSKKWTIIRLVLLVAQAFVPLATLYLMKLVVDVITIALQSPEAERDFSGITLYVLLFGAVALFNAVVNILAQLAGEAQQQLVADHMSAVLQAKSIEIDLEYYENPEYHDTFHRAQEEALYRPVQILNSLTAFLQNGLSLGVIAGLLLFLHWGIAVVLILSTLPLVFVRLRFSRKLYEWEKSRTSLERESWYINWVLTAAYFAKEVRLFDFGKALSGQFSGLRDRLFGEKLAIQQLRSWASLAAQGGEILAVTGTYLFIAYQTIQGAITLGDLVMYFQAFQKGQGLLHGVMSSMVRLYESRLFLHYIFDFLRLQPKIKEPAQPDPLPDILREGIVFEDVTFHYPLTRQEVLKNISATFPKGQVVALVGENGSGKTTLIKLLCRLYDPDAGAIRIDGVDLRTCSTEQLHRKIAVIYQDFAQYHFTVKENIQISDLQAASEEKVVESARASGADVFIQQLPRTYDQRLGREYFDGAELSQGQWQKIALSRAFYKDAEIIILDEPTSSIDPLAEHTIFSKLSELRTGKIIILVTHRLYNLKLADKILVMDNGRIVEEGSHEELVAKGGKYRRMFEKQI